MALDKDRMGQAIADAIALVSTSNPITPTEIANVWKAASDEIIKEFTNNGIVTTTVTGTLPDGAEAATGDGGIS